MWSGENKVYLIVCWCVHSISQYYHSGEEAAACVRKSNRVCVHQHHNVVCSLFIWRSGHRAFIPVAHCETQYLYRFVLVCSVRANLRQCVMSEQEYERRKQCISKQPTNTVVHYGSRVEVSQYCSLEYSSVSGTLFQHFALSFPTGAMLKPASTGNSKPRDATQGPLVQWSSGGAYISWHWEPMFSGTSMGKSAPVLEGLPGCGLQHNSKHCKQRASVTALNCAMKFLSPSPSCCSHLQTILYLWSTLL